MTLRKRKVAKPVRAWTWLCDFGLCLWAAPSRAQLRADGERPSPEAKMVRVEIREVPRKRRAGK